MINVGLGMYGRSFTLSNPSQHDLGSPVRGAGQAGMYTREGGFLSYYEVSNQTIGGVNGFLQEHYTLPQK